MKVLLTSVDRALMRLYTVAGALAATLLVVLALLIIAAIVTRLTGHYVPGLNAYAGYAMGGSTFLAMAYTLRHGGHIRVNILLNALSGRWAWFLRLWCFLAGSVIAVFFATYLVRMTVVSFNFGELSEGADATPLWIPQTAMAVGAVILAISVIHHLARFVFGLTGPIDGEGGEV